MEKRIQECFPDSGRSQDEGAPNITPEDQSALPDQETLGPGIARAIDALLSRQEPDGCWVEPLEADVTITSEYVLLQFLLKRVPEDFFQRAAPFILASQGEDGGWPLYHGGPADISATVKAYFALKLLGYSAGHPALVRARALVHERGGAINVNVFTRIALALFGQYDWKGIPALPPEMILLPKWFPLSIYTVSYWSRTVIVPLLFIYHHKPMVALETEVGISELFVTPMSQVKVHYSWSSQFLSWKNLFFALDILLQFWNRHPIPFLRRMALKKGLEWLVPRMKGEGGLGAIYPAMANSVLALRLAGYHQDHPLVQRAIQSIDDLVFEIGDKKSVQPCFSPIWDTALALGALYEAGVSRDAPQVARAFEWFRRREVRLVGDWAVRVRGVGAGGWAFQYENDYYPDIDDTSVVLMDFAKWYPGMEGYEAVFRRALEWVLSMQGTDGGWAAFDKDNDFLFLNNIPFADHGALLDPSTSDVTGRVVELLGILGYGPDVPPVRRAMRFLRKEQEADGSWYGRWGVNYIYGIWSVVSALKAIGEEMSSGYIQRAMNFLLAHQNPDGGWGESCYSYFRKDTAGVGGSTPSQTAWALISLIHGGHVTHPAVSGGIRFLLSRQGTDGKWEEKDYTGTGFPKVFYLRYNMYRDYFPLWALALYRNVLSQGRSRVDERTVSWRRNPYPIAPRFLI
ncbi:MAG: squalene--hopene cyclase [Leptospirales bacterium]